MTNQDKARAKIEAALKKKGYATQIAIAADVGVSSSLISRILAGHHFPSPEVMVKLIDLLGGKVTADDFLDLYGARL